MKKNILRIAIVALAGSLNGFVCGCGRTYEW